MDISVIYVECKKVCKAAGKGSIYIGSKMTWLRSQIWAISLTMKVLKISRKCNI